MNYTVVSDLSQYAQYSTDWKKINPDKRDTLCPDCNQRIFRIYFSPKGKVQFTCRLCDYILDIIDDAVIIKDDGKYIEKAVKDTQTYLNKIDIKSIIYEEYDGIRISKSG